MIVHALYTWHCYLEDVECVVVTNHDPITHLKSQHNLSRREVRWLDYLEQHLLYI